MTVIVVNLDGAELLPACLDSLRMLDYDGDRSVVVVDNGSTDGSVELLADGYPEVVVLPQGANTGFARAVNTGVRAAPGERVALLNNDMRVEPRWLSELSRHLDRATGTVCVGGVITSSDGITVDFADASIAFNGMGDQPGFGTPLASVDLNDGDDLLFACGGSMLVDREVFLDVGGFDESFFAYYEDVDFGWRLNLAGYRVALAAGARSFHLHHGTAGRFPRYQRELLIERNALATAIKNYDDAHLAEVLPAALLLLAKRGVRKAELDRASFDIGGSADEQQVVGRDVLATLVAVSDLVDDLPGLFERRKHVQALRRRPDEDLIGRFGFPLRPQLLDAEYLSGLVSVVRALKIDPAFQRQRAVRVLVVGAEDDPFMTGLATAAGRLAATRLVGPKEDPDPGDDVWSTADVVVARPAALSGRPLGTWPVVVAVVEDDPVEAMPARADAVLAVDDRSRPAWETALAEDGEGRVLLGGTGADALATVLRAPWRHREARRSGSWRRAVTEDVNLLLDARNAQRLDAEQRLAAEQHARWLDLQLLGRVRVALELRRNEVEDLHALLGAAQAELEATRAELKRLRWSPQVVPRRVVDRARGALGKT